MPIRRRKRHMISLSPEEFEKLSALKGAWEDWTGGRLDWGGFLMHVTGPSATVSPSLIRIASQRKIENRDSRPDSGERSQIDTELAEYQPSVRDVLDDLLVRLEALEESRSPLSEIDGLLLD